MEGKDNRASRIQLSFSLAVVATMLIMFTVPSDEFVDAAFFSTTVMILAAWRLGAFRGFHPTAKSIGLGIVSALVLYGIFYAGNAGVQALHPFGITSSNEGSIYSLIASPSNPGYLQVGLLAFDAVGYESFFRGFIQKRASARSPFGAPFAVAALDALIHVPTLNPLWVVTTFIADSVWGLNLLYGKDLGSNVLSHFLWDVLIFLVIPIK